MLQALCRVVLVCLTNVYDCVASVYFRCAVGDRDEPLLALSSMMAPRPVLSWFSCRPSAVACLLYISLFNNRRVLSWLLGRLGQVLSSFRSGDPMLWAELIFSRLGGTTAFFLSTLPHVLSCFSAVVSNGWVIPVTSQIWVVKTVLVAAGLLIGFVQGFRWSPIAVNTCEDISLLFEYCFTNDLHMLWYEDMLLPLCFTVAFIVADHQCCSCYSYHVHASTSFMLTIFMLKCCTYAYHALPFSYYILLFAAHAW